VPKINTGSMDIRITTEIMQTMYAGRTLIFAHSGAQAYAPGNTMPAFELAVQQGAGGVELDVHRSHDGHAVVIHDATVDSATDGIDAIADMRLAQIRALDAGAKFAPASEMGTRVSMQINKPA